MFVVLAHFLFESSMKDEEEFLAIKKLYSIEKTLIWENLYVILKTK